MGYLVTISNGHNERLIEMPGILTDEEWKKKQQITETRWKKAKKINIHRVGKQWVAT